MIEESVASSIRHFNRYYTNKLGLLARYRFDTKMTLTEARVLFEIGRRGAHTQNALGAELRIDGGYLNRIVTRLVERGLVGRRKDEDDGRLVLLELTDTGRVQARLVDEVSDEDALSLVEGLDHGGAEELLGHMRAIERILEGLGEARPVVDRAVSVQDLAAARVLMREYMTFLGENLDFQGIEEELEGLPGKYAAPTGALFIARLSGARGGSYAGPGEPAGCVALRRLDEGICEMKRLFVRPEYRGYGIGRELTLRVIDAARALGYDRMRLDTLERLEGAVGLYRSLGFEEIPPYCENPLEGASFWEKKLR